MNRHPDPKYFVLGVAQEDRCLVVGAVLQIQVLNEFGEGEVVAYFGSSSNKALAFIHARPGPPQKLDVVIPDSIVDVTRGRPSMPGYYLDETGAEAFPSFLKPTKAKLEAARENDNRRNRIFREEQ
jgi:hypothetical protein